MRSIPTSPSGMTLSKTKNVKKLSPNILKYTSKQTAMRQKDGSSSWKRATAQHVFPAVVTSLKPDDAIAGACIHWQQDRVLTIMEARRAQGFLDDEPIIGSPTKQYKIVGNSVARSVSLALGMSLREAWLSNPPNAVERFMTEPSVELPTETRLGGDKEAWSGPMVVITTKTVGGTEDIVIEEHSAAGSELPADAFPTRPTSGLLGQTRLSVQQVRTGPIVVIPQKVLSSYNILKKSELQKKRGWKRWVGIDEDEAPQGVSKAKKGYDTRHEMHDQSGRVAGLSFQTAIIIQDSDSDEEDYGVKNALPRTSRPIPPLEPFAPRAPVATADSTASFRTPRSRRARFIVPESDSEYESDSEEELESENTINSNDSVANQEAPLSYDIEAFEEPVTHLINFQRKPLLPHIANDLDASGKAHLQSTIPRNASQQPPALPSMIPADFEMLEVPFRDASEEAEDEHESMFVPFRMFASQTPNLIVLDSDSESDGTSGVEELSFRRQFQRINVNSTAAGCPPTRIYNDLDEFDD